MALRMMLLSIKYSTNIVVVIFIINQCEIF